MNPAFPLDSGCCYEITWRVMYCFVIALLSADVALRFSDDLLTRRKQLRDVRSMRSRSCFTFIYVLVE